MNVYCIDVNLFLRDLALLDANHHTVGGAFDMVWPQAIDLANAQAGAIDHCQQCPMLKVEGGLQDLFYRLAGQYNRPMMGASTRGDMEVGPVPAQDLLVETAIRAEVDIDRAPG